MSLISHSSKPRLILGTGNRHKAAELATMLAPLGLEVRSLADVADPIAVEENGATFVENATLKATQQARHLQSWVLADDSGLAVDALDGAPGVISARYAGPGATDLANRHRLLEALAAVPLERRGAHFACYLVLADSSGAVRATAEGRCHGRIRTAEAGAGGFGYDSLFEIREYHRTFGELSEAVKNCLSHRGRAIGAILPAIAELLGSGQWGAARG